MSYFGLNPVNQNQQLDTAASNPVGAASTDVGFFDGAISAGAAGVYSGLVAKPDQLLWAGLDKVVSPVAEFVNQATGITDSSPEFIAEQRKLAQQQVKRLTPDAATTGTAGQILNGLFDMGGQAIAGTVLAGPMGGAAAVTALQGFSEFESLRAKGVNFGTAQEAGLIQGITAGAGTLIPMSLGLRAGGAVAESVGAQLAGAGGNAARNIAATAARAAPDIAYAAATNIAFGMAQRGLTAQTLRKGGYNEMANQYDVFDNQSIAIDAVLGVAFGGVGRFINSRGESVKAPEFTPADVDAALAANSAHHAEIDVALGVPVNVLSRNAHAQALQKAMQDISEGNPVDVASITEAAAFSDIPARRSLISQALDESLSRTDEGATQQELSTRVLEQQAEQVLSRGDRQVYQSEIANSQRIINNLTEQRNEVLAKEATGRGKALAAARKEKQSLLREIDQKLNEAKGRLEYSHNALAPHEPGGKFFEARAELARRQQAETVADNQALAYYRTPDIAPVSPAAFDASIITRESTSRPTPEQAADTDIRTAEESLASSPEMTITMLDEEGKPQQRSAREALDTASREHEQAVKDSSLFDVAIACFLRG